MTNMTDNIRKLSNWELTLYAYSFIYNENNGVIIPRVGRDFPEAPARVLLRDMCEKLHEKGFFTNKTIGHVSLTSEHALDVLQRFSKTPQWQHLASSIKEERYDLTKQAKTFEEYAEVAEQLTLLALLLNDYDAAYHTYAMIAKLNNLKDMEHRGRYLSAYYERPVPNLLQYETLGHHKWLYAHLIHQASRLTYLPYVQQHVADFSNEIQALFFPSLVLYAIAQNLPLPDLGFLNSDLPRELCQLLLPALCTHALWSNTLDSLAKLATVFPESLMYISAVTCTARGQWPLAAKQYASLFQELLHAEDQYLFTAYSPLILTALITNYITGTKQKEVKLQIRLLQELLSQSNNIHTAYLGGIGKNSSSYYNPSFDTDDSAALSSLVTLTRVIRCTSPVIYANEKINEKCLPACLNQFRQAREHGQILLATYLACAMANFNKFELPESVNEELATFVSSTPFVPFLAVSTTPQWQVKLDKLQLKLLETRTLDKNDSDQDMNREGFISWHIQIHTPLTLYGDSTDDATQDKFRTFNEIFPKLHLRLKNGQFSETGRKINIKKLYSGEYDQYLDGTDKALLPYIKVSRGYGYYESESHYISKDAIAALVGHSRVVLCDDVDFSVPVTVVEDKNAIIVTKGEKYIYIRPKYFDTLSRTLLNLSDLPVLKFHQFTEEDPIIAAFKPLVDENTWTIQCPLQAEESIRQLIGKIAPMHSILGDFDDVAYSQLKVVHAQHELHALVSRDNDNEFTFTFKNRPVPELELLQTPGVGAQSTPVTLPTGEQILLKRNLNEELASFKTQLHNSPTLHFSTASATTCHLDDLEQVLATLQFLHDANVIIDWNSSNPIKLNRASKSSPLTLSHTSADEWFSITGNLKVNEKNVVQLQQLLEALDSRTGDFIRLSENNYLQLTKDLLRKLEALKAAGACAKDTLTIAPAALPMLSNVFTDGLPNLLQEQLERMKAAFQNAIQTPNTLRGTLRPYQADGFRYLARLADCHIGCCLADDMGLGKTIQLLTLLLREASHGPALVVCPAAITRNWLREAEKFAPTLRATVLPMTGRAGLIEQASNGDLIICTYGVLLTENEMFATKKWHTVILDEAQAIKNQTAKRTKSAKTLQADIRIASTGTPVENHLLELWSIFDFLNPGLLGNSANFERKFTTGDGLPNSRLKRLVSPLILRRCKEDVLDDLPPKTEITIPVELPDEEMEVYEAMRRKALDELSREQNSRITILAQLTKLRRYCCHPSLANDKLKLQGAKLQRIVDIILQLKEAGQKTLVFSQFVDFLTILRQHLEQNGITYQYLDGATSQKARMDAVDNFQQGNDDAFLISIKAGGVGLNLTAASYIIIADPWWNPAVEDQAADRAHRIGQTQPVTVYRLITSNTVEEKVLALHERKRQASADILDGAESSEITEQDLRALFE